MCHHAGTMHKVAWRHFCHAVYTRIHVYESGQEKVSSGNLAHWPRPTENWWSDPRSELLDWQNPETGPKLSADPRSTVFFKSANPLDLSPKSTIRELFKAKSADPRTYSPPSDMIWCSVEKYVLNFKAKSPNKYNLVNSSLASKIVA